MDLRQLRYFKVLAAHQHFGRAATVLHIAQPALSRQIQALESELGVSLVTRHSRGASVTVEGELLLERATYLLHFADQIKLDIVELQGTPRGPVVLGLPPALANFIVPPLVTAMMARYPDVHLRVIEGFSPALCEGLVQGTIDFAVLSGPIVATPLIHVEPLLTENICAVAPAGDSRLPNGQITVEDLQGIPLIVTGVRTSGVRLALDRATALAGIKLNEVIEVETATVATQLVSEGVGWTIHYAAAVAREVESGTLRVAPIKGLMLSRFLAHAVLRPLSKATVSMVALLQETAASLVHEGRWPMAQMVASRPMAGVQTQA